MIWVFTIVKDNIPINQFIHIGDLPNYETFKKKLNDDKLLSHLFETMFYGPWMQTLRKLDQNDNPHAGFKYNDAFFLCTGFPNA